MKNQGGVIFLFLLIITSFVWQTNFVSSESISDTMDSIRTDVQDTASTVKTAKDTLTNEESRKDYLKKQWVSILENRTGFKQVISIYRKVSPYSNPIIEYIVGMKPELSLFFVLVFVVWFFLVKYFFTVYDILRDLSMFSKGASIMIFIGSFAILIIIQVFQMVSIFFANKLVVLTEFLTSPIMKVVAFIVFVVVIIFLSKFSKQVKVLSRYNRMKRYQAQKNKEIEEVAEDVREIKKQEVVNKSLGGSSSTESFDYTKGMRRGGEKSGSSRFVKKASAERFARRFGNDAAKERFGSSSKKDDSSADVFDSGSGI